MELYVPFHPCGFWRYMDTIPTIVDLSGIVSPFIQLLASWMCPFAHRHGARILERHRRGAAHHLSQNDRGSFWPSSPSAKNSRGSRGGYFGHFLERCSLAQIARKHTKSQRNSFYCHAVGNVFFLFSSVGEFRVKEEDASAVLDTVNHCHCIVSCFLRHFCRLYQCLSLYRGQLVKSLLCLVHQHQHSISSPLDN